MNPSEVSEELHNRREELRASLGVPSWPVPGQVPAPADLPDGTPAWWRGEEEASASFLRAMNVQLPRQG